MYALCARKDIDHYIKRNRTHKLKEFAEDKINVTQKLKFDFGRVENIVRKSSKMLVTSIFSFSHNVFKRLLFQGC